MHKKNIHGGLTLGRITAVDLVSGDAFGLIIPKMEDSTGRDLFLRMEYYMQVPVPLRMFLWHYIQKLVNLYGNISLKILLNTLK